MTDIEKIEAAIRDSHVEDEKHDITAAAHVETLAPQALDTNTKFQVIQIDAVAAEEFELSLTNLQAIKLYKKAIFWAFIASLSIIMEGYDTSCTGSYTALPQFREYFGNFYPKINEWQIPTKWMSALGVAGTLGNFIGIPLGGFLIDRFGYRKALNGNYLFIIPLIAISAFARNLPMLLAGGLLQGIPFGVFSTLGCGYASEVCPVKLRGYLTGWINICWVLGILFGTGIANVIINIPGQWGFRAGYMTQWCWPIPLFILMWIAPDAPWWLVRNNRISDAEVALKRITHSSMHEHVPGIVRNMVRTYQLEVDVAKGSRWVDCFRGVDLRRTEIACMAFACQTLCGDPFAGGPIYFFQQAGMSDKMAFKLGLVNPALMFFANLVAYYLMSRFGRRTLYCTGMFSLMLLLILIGGLQEAADKVNPNAKWGIAAVTFAWNIVRAMTIGPECYSIVAEVSSSRLRNQTIAFARLTYQIVGLIVNFLEPWLMNPTALNLKGRTAFVWAPICFFAWVWCYFRLPELKDRSYYELDVLFERKVAARKFASTEVEAYADDEIRDKRHIAQHF